MQYHYLVGYDTELKKWFIPEYNTHEAHIDKESFRILHYIVDTFPIPKEYENA